MRMCLLDLGSRISGSGFGTSLRFSIGMIHFEDLKIWGPGQLLPSSSVYREQQRQASSSREIALRCMHSGRGLEKRAPPAAAAAVDL